MAIQANVNGFLGFFVVVLKISFTFTLCSQSQPTSFHPYFHLLYPPPPPRPNSSCVAPSWVPHLVLVPCLTTPFITCSWEHTASPTTQWTLHMYDTETKNSSFLFIQKQTWWDLPCLNESFQHLLTAPVKLGCSCVGYVTLKLCINVLKCCSYWFTGSGTSYFCNDLGKCACVVGSRSALLH